MFKSDPAGTLSDLNGNLSILVCCLVTTTFVSACALIHPSDAPLMFPIITSHNGLSMQIAFTSPLKNGEVMATLATGAVRTVPSIIRYV